MEKVRIKEIAEELGVKPKDVLDACNELAIGAKSHASLVSEQDAEKIMQYFMGGLKKPAQVEAQPNAVAPLATSAASEVKVPQTPRSPAKATPSDANKTNTVAAATPAEPEPEAEPKKGVRRGLVIVKKKREESSESAIATRREPMIRHKPLTEEEERFLASSKKKKAKKTLAAPAKKEKLEKIELFKDRDISSDVDEENEEVIMLPDFANFQTETIDEDLIDIRKPIIPTRNKTSSKKLSASSSGTINLARVRRRRRPRDEKNNEEVTSVEIPEEIRVYEFAEKINKPLGEVIKVLFNLGMMVTKNDFLDKDTIEILADEFGIEVHIREAKDEMEYLEEGETREENLKPRPPIVTIMGHVDHGKTSLLDKIRNSRVAAGEAGGITQHIGAYVVEKNGHDITFIDTPGHEAFTQMRARGAQVTDVAIIVVAADDGVMPQTIEAINHVKAANVPFIIAINKMDKPTANPDYVKTQLAEHGITPVEWGGEYEFIPVSAHTGMGIEDLLETILLQTEIMELKADDSKRGRAIVIESALEKGRGPVSTVIVKDGTLHVGDSVVVGANYGRIRAIINENGQSLKELKPGYPGQILGLDGTATPGDTLIAVENEKVAREYAEKRKEYLRQRELSKSTKASLEELGALVAEGQLKRLNVILKTDYHGTLEAIKSSLEKMRNEEVKVNVVHAAVGAITESDVDLASATENTIIVGFNVKAPSSVKEKAKSMNVDIRHYTVLYDIIEDIKTILSGILSPVETQNTVGVAEVRQIFDIPKVGVIAGCVVIDGVISVGSAARLLRAGEVIYEGEIESLKRFKDDVKEVKKGLECGIALKDFTSFMPGDKIECLKTVYQKATFN
ncbi:MAG: translation initiation factor IF-2 [Campylobacterales bacterium]